MWNPPESRKVNCDVARNFAPGFYNDAGVPYGAPEVEHAS